jgi:NTE family protein
LSVLLPVLEAQGQRPTVFVGTSVGGINAAYLAATAHHSADEAAAGLLRLWRQTRLEHVVRPLVYQQIPLLGARLVASLLGAPGTHVASLLDPSPIGHNLTLWNDWAALRANVEHGRVHAVAVLATAVSSERTVVFCDSAAGIPSHRSHILDYVHTQLAVEHVQAAAAIPLLFPPVHVADPARASGWYLDGGLRLNTPIKPALDLGADRLVVIATSAITERADPAEDEPISHNGRDAHRRDEHGRGGPPDLGDVALTMLHGKLVDPLIEDLRTLGNINTFFSDGAPDSQRYRQARGKPPYRQVPYIAVAPRHTAVIADLATTVFHKHYSRLKRLRSPDLALLSWLLGANSPTHNELFSYIFFAPEFIEELINTGARDARTWLDQPPGPSAPGKSNHSVRSSNKVDQEKRTLRWQL